MDFWMPIMFEPEDQIIELARTAEAAGVRGVALADHVAVPVGYESVHPSGEHLFDHDSRFVDPLVTAAAILAATKRIEVLTYAYVLPLREPLNVAKQVGTLATLFGERFRFGVGVGWLVEEVAVFAPDARTRGRRADEMLEIMRRCWDDGTVEYHGAQFDFGPVGMYPLPSPRPSVWVGGESERALARAARHDGWMGMTYPPDEMWALLERVNACRRGRPGGPNAPFEVFLSPSTEPTPELYREMESRGVTSTLAMPWWPGHPDFAALPTKQAALGEFMERIVQKL